MSKKVNKRVKKKVKNSRIEVDSTIDTSKKTGRQLHKEDMARIKAGSPDKWKTARTAARTSAAANVAESHAKAKAADEGMAQLLNPETESNSVNDGEATSSTTERVPGSSDLW